jgi:hypothetical protein
MLGSQIMFIVSVAMLTVGGIFHRLYSDMPEGVNLLADYENMGMIGVAAFLISIGSVLFLASVALIVTQIKNLDDRL